MSALTPAPELDAVFDEPPPTADEWRWLACVLAAMFAMNEEFAGAIGRDDVLRHCLLTTRERRKAAH